ncbi:MAG: IS630 family transposase [candidate division KSB1 bacterium]|nr:IS630 family transposase [candidate division KSB1 bacterium]
MAKGRIPELNEAQRALLISAQKKILKPKHLKRVQAVLARSEGMKVAQIARVLRVDRTQISRWVRVYCERGIETLLQDASRPGRIKPVSPELEEKVCRLTVQEKPKNATHWTTRTMAKRVGLSHNKVAEIWRKYGLKPHIVKRFKMSRDPEFESKMADVVGLYLNPPKKSIVFCVDEKSQIQALQRSQPNLPMRPGSPERQTHDYYRHGTTTLFAALDVVSGKVLGQCKERHRASDFIDFLKYIDANTPRKMDLHIISDNHSAHKTAEVKKFLEMNPRFKRHFTPTSSSWLNLGALVCRDNQQTHSARRLDFCARSYKGDLRIHTRMEQRPQAISLD